MPDSVCGFNRQTVAELMRQQNDLSAVMSLVEEHVAKHRSTGRPNLRPSSAGEFWNAALRVLRQSVGEHAETLRSAFFMRSSGVFQRATKGIERCRTFQVRRGILQPHQAAVVQVGEDGGDGASVTFFAGRLSAPRTRIEMREEELVHRIVD